MNETHTILTKVRDVFKASFNLDPQSVSMETKPRDIPAWDSTGHLSLVSDLEVAFNISLNVDEMMEMESVRDIVRVIEGKLAKPV
jgi:acyl carrier protein